MAMGRRELKQAAMWIEADELARSPGHPFYEKLNQILEEHGFDVYVEDLCREYYAQRNGRPSIAPGTYFRMLFVGYFEGIDSERGIAWRSADSLALRTFLNVGLSESAPDHSTISRTRNRIEVETHKQVFNWVLKVLAQEGLLEGKTIGVDASTLEANAALRSIVRRDSGESYEQYLIDLAKASGIETPSRDDLKKLDKKRPRKGSNDDWEHPHDPDARITKMKDGRTHLAHKAEHAVDFSSGAVVAVTVQHADLGDSTTVQETLAETQRQLQQLGSDPEVADQVEELREVVADKGYHSNATMVHLEQAGLRSYVSEPDRGRRNWKKNREAQQPTYANRRRIRGDRGKALQRKRGELLERAFAHYLETGAMRRTYLRGHSKILKRLLIHVGAFNLGVLMRNLIGRGTPRALHELSAALAFLLRQLRSHFHSLLCSGNSSAISAPSSSFGTPIFRAGFSTGC